MTEEMRRARDNRNGGEARDEANNDEENNNTSERNLDPDMIR